MKLFFSGIGGSGVSALAGFASEKGINVSGSDRLFDADPGNRLCQRLKSAGISIFPQDGSGIDDRIEKAVFSTAVEETNPDYLRAKELRVPIETRPQYLAGLVSDYRTIAVAGTSGKSTTSGMLAYVMEQLGLSPNFIGGGRVKQFRSQTNAGNFLAGGSDYLVIEACESDGSIANYRPEHSILLNLALDHHEVAETCKLFRTLSDNTPGLIIASGDDENLASCGFGNARFFSVDEPSNYRAADVEYHPLKTVFAVRGLKYDLSLPGKHNLYNALACIALLSELGIREERIAGALAGFTGIERRFDVHLDNGRFLVVDDYAHNPHKISYLMQTMQRAGRATCYIFQPHGFGPTRLMKEGYIEAFSDNLRDSDHLVLLPIYYAGGTAAKDISSADLAKGISARGRSVEVVENRDLLIERAFRWDSCVVMGARDDSLAALAENISEKLR